MTFTRIAGIAGFVFTGLLLVLNSMLGASARPLEATASTSDIGGWFSENTLVVDVMTAGATLIWVAMTIFGVGILLATRSPEGSVNPWAVVGMVGVTMQHAIFSQVIATDAVLAARADAGDGFGELAWQLHHASFSLNNLSIALALGGFAFAAIGSGLAPRWTRWVAVAGVAGLWLNSMQTSLLLRGDGFFALGLVGFLGWVTFAVILSIRLLRSQPPAAA